MKWYDIFLNLLAPGASYKIANDKSRVFDAMMSRNVSGSSDSVPASDPDSDYMKMIEKYKGTDYYNYFASNPYLRQNNAEFSPTFLQRLGEDILGDTSARDAYYANLQSQSNQYFAQGIENMRQDAYNSPVAMNARNKAAGINSDLAGGISGVPSAADNDVFAPQGVEMNPASAGSSAIQSLGSAITQAFSFGFSIVQTMQGIRSLNLDNEAKEVGVLSSVNSMSDFFIEDNLPVDFADGSPIVFDDNMRSLVRKYGDDAFHSRRLSRIFSDNVERNYSSLRGYSRRFRGVKDFADARYDAGLSLGRNDVYQSSEDDNDIFGLSGFRSISRVLADAELKILKMSNRADYAEESNRAVYNESLEPGTAAEALNSGNEASIENNKASKSMNSIRKVVNDTAYKVIDVLSEKSNEGGIEGALSSAALIAVFGMMNNVVPSLPGVSFSKSESSKGSKFNFSIH